MSAELQIFKLFKKAYKRMREAANQSHSGHWDMHGTHGRNCPECIRAKRLRDEADKFFDKACWLREKIDG